MNYTQLFESKTAQLGNMFIPAQNGDYVRKTNLINLKTL